MRAVPQEEAAEAMAWLSARGDREAALGYHPDGWPDSVWILHAMYEQPAPDVSANGFRRELIVEPFVLPGLDVAAYSTGIPLGFTETPGEGWTRLTWRSLTERLGRRLGEGMTYPVMAWCGALSWGFVPVGGGRWSSPIGAICTGFVPEDRWSSGNLHRSSRSGK